MKEGEFEEELIALINKASKNNIDAIYIIGILDLIKSNVLKALQEQENAEKEMDEETKKMKSLAQRHMERTEDLK